MKRKWVITASALIIVGLIGLMLFKFDITDKNLIEFEHEFEFGENMTLEDLIVLGNSSNMNINFVSGNNNKTFITIEGKEQLLVKEKIRQANLVDGKFKLDLTYKESFRIFSIGFENRILNITVSLPKGHELNQLDVDLKSGNVKVNDVIAQLGNVEVSSGRVEINNSEVNTLVINAISGNVNIKEQKGNLAVEVKSGNINIDQLSGSSEIKSTSGKIKLVQHDDQGAIISATSGNVDVTQHKASNANIEVFSGNVKLKVAEDFAGFFELKANSGNIKAPESARLSDHLVKIKTTSGNINVSQ